MIQVLNKYTAKPLELAFSISVMRPSLLGNPFDKGTREENVENHRQWLWAQIQANTAVAQELRRLAIKHLRGDTIYLCCCCVPKPCHGNTLKRAIEYLANTQEVFWAFIFPDGVKA